MTGMWLVLVALLGAQATDRQPAAAPVPAQVLDALERLPAHGSGADMGLDGSAYWLVASGTGSFIPRDDVERAMPLPLRRARAVRAAVVDAKVAAAELIQARISSGVEVKGGERPTMRSEVVTQVQRKALCAMQAWRITVQPDEDGQRARVLLYATRIGSTPDATAGLPCFANEEQAARAILAWMRNGLCTDGTVRLLVGTPDKARLRTFGVGLATADPEGRRVAETLARAGLLGDRPGVASGRTASSLVSRHVDPLSREGNDALLQDRFFRERAFEVRGRVIEQGNVKEELPEGVAACVMWGEAVELQKP